VTSIVCSKSTEGSTEAGSAFLGHILNSEAANTSKRKILKNSLFFQNPILASIAETSCATLPGLTSLLNKADTTFSDTLIIQSVYFAVAPLFVGEPPAKKGKGKEGNAGSSVLKTLRAQALGCLRGVSNSAARLADYTNGPNRYSQSTSNSEDGSSTRF